jgi:hypothetical protein
MISIFLIAMMCLCIANTAMAATNDANAVETSKRYMDEHVPRKLALIIGNYEYPHLGDLPGVESDIANVKARFEKLGFDVVDPYPNVRNWDDFQYKVLKPFRAKIERDDLAVVSLRGSRPSLTAAASISPRGTCL